MTTRLFSSRSGRKDMNRHQTQGYATLVVTVILMVLATIASLYATRTTIADIRATANAARYQEALMSAEGWLDRSVAYLRHVTPASLNVTSWPQCKSSTFIFDRADELPVPLAVSMFADDYCGNLPGVLSDRVFVVARQQSDVTGTPYANKWIYTLVAVGDSATDATARAIVRQSYHYAGETGYELMPPPPLMGAGKIDIKGDMTIVTNPNGGCGFDNPDCNVPVSIWTESTTAGSTGSWQSCQQQEYADGVCSSSTAGTYLSKKDLPGVDIVEAGAFPADMFSYIFGYSAENYQDFLENDGYYITQLDDCDNLEAVVNGLSRTESTLPIVWVNGECNVPNNSNIGINSGEVQPIILIVKDGDFNMGSLSSFYGMAFAFAVPVSGVADAGDVSINANSFFYGSILSNDNTTVGQILNGGFTIQYDDSVVKSLIGSITNERNRLLVKIPGSWADYMQ